MRRSLLIAVLGCLSAITIAQESVQQGKQRATQSEIANSDQDGGVPKVSQDKPMSFWMKHKLDYSKEMLESLTMGEFEKLASTADQMRLLGKIEGFVRRKDPAYRVQLNSFDLAAQELVRHAKQENPDGATLAFNQMTASCVACHTLLRKGID